MLPLGLVAAALELSSYQILDSFVYVKGFYWRSRQVMKEHRWKNARSEAEGRKDV
jgi:hypothetical protein